MCQYDKIMRSAEYYAGSESVKNVANIVSEKS
jgi:hypothetical protein